MKKNLLSIVYIILLFAIVFFQQVYSFSYNGLTITSFDPAGFIELLCFLSFGAFLGLPYLVKTIKTHGKISLNGLSLALSIISFAFIISRIINFPLIPSINQAQNIYLIIFGYSLITIVKKEPAAQISK